MRSTLGSPARRGPATLTCFVTAATFAFAFSGGAGDRADGFGAERPQVGVTLLTEAHVFYEVVADYLKGIPVQPRVPVPVGLVTSASAGAGPGTSD